jgi:predicted nucleic acid-binding protein
MTLLFDTSILIDLENNKPQIREKIRALAQLHPAPGVITFINEFEFLVGLKRKTPKNRIKSELFLRKFLIIQSSRDTGRILANLKDKYQKLGKLPALADLIIASIAIENNKILVTIDQDFKHIEELQKIIIEE